MGGASAISLLAAAPELTDVIPAADLALAAQVQVPALRLPAGEFDLRATLIGAGGVSLLVTDGMLLQRLAFAGHVGIRLLGPGDVLTPAPSSSAALTVDTGLRATAPTHTVVIGHEFWVAGRRWPTLTRWLHMRCAEMAERLATQMLICQLPRVDERLLGMLWLLAESWGRVTRTGTLLPVQLTHAALGGLVGARRSTVTLAVRELSDRGALLRQNDGWLLLQQLENLESLGGRSALTAIDNVPRPTPNSMRWLRDAAEPAAELERRRALHAELSRTVERLRAEHELAREQVTAQLEDMAAVRGQIATQRERLTRDRMVRERRSRRAPS